eukprot:CAMPEP_0194341060 /NCGR_PEP_ID=MMETSP0171-20130528/88462_1 /TAXON_ID=218684 /ORGANISM="Corethron pennatum, Strain L29A3" /LENGTH=189 /DNA_ID=CAMNT_0039106255 /DNA_START=560 /DNA_END=1126 /DNA_ORIENTATION=+
MKILEFSTHADPGAAVGGNFALTYYWDTDDYLFASSLEMASDIGPGQLRVFLQERLPVTLGEIEVERSVNSECGCTGAFTWTITVRDALDMAGDLVSDGSGLNGDGSGVTPVRTVRDVSPLGGVVPSDRSPDGHQDPEHPLRRARAGPPGYPRDGPRRAGGGGGGRRQRPPTAHPAAGAPVDRDIRPHR